MRPVEPRQQLGRIGAAAAVLVAAAAVYFWPIVAPSPTRSITSDLGAYTYPWRRYVTQELFLGRLPHWTPYAGYGFPLLADIEATVLYPVSLIGSLVSGGDLTYRATQIENLVHYPVAGLGMYLLLARTGTGWAGAMVGALTLMFSGFFWAHVAHVTVLESASWVPWLLLGVVHLLERPTGRAIVGTGLVLALSILGGHPQVTWLACVAAGVLLLFAGVARVGPGERAPLLHVAAGTGLAAVVGAGLAAVQLGPTTVLARYSDRWEPIWSFLLDDTFPPENLLTLLVPMAFRNTPRWSSLDELHGYMGVLPLALALWALLRDRGRWTGTFAVMAGLGLLMALGLQPFVWVASAGLFRIPARGLLLLSIGVSALAGRGADALWRTPAPGDAAGERRARRDLWLAAAAAVAVGIWLAAAGLPAPLASVLSRDFVHDWAGFAALLVAAVVAMAAARRVRAAPWLARGIVIVALLVDALSFPRDIAWSREQPGLRWPKRSQLADLARDPGPYRVMLASHTAAKNAGAVYRLPVASVYSSLTLASLHEFDLVLWDSLGDNIFPLTGTRWVAAGADSRTRAVPHVPVDSSEPESRPARFHPIGRDMWEVENPLPRAYLPAEVRIMPSRLDLRSTLQHLWPTDAVLVESTTRCPSRRGWGAAPGAARFEIDEPHRVRLRVRAEEAGPLVLSDTYYRGWTATVDGRAARVVRANLIFRMVCVPAGEHLVEFTFRQPKFHLGLGITIATAIGALLIVLGPGARTRIRRPR
jgi:hypothetical protein